MIDALVGAVIAVIATSALTLLAEVMTTVETFSKSSLTEYEESVFNVVNKAHGSARSSDDLLKWLVEQAARSGEL